MSKKKNKKEELIELQIESIGFNGVSVAKQDGLVYFVNGGVPGDIVRAKIYKKKKSYVECSIEEVLSFSRDRVEPLCAHFPYCGGCTWQNYNYERQIFWKAKHVEEAFQRLHKVEVNKYEPILKSPRVFNYRNKMEFSFSGRRWLTPEEIQQNNEYGTEILQKDFALGLHVKNAFDKILDIKHCDLQKEEANIILNLTESLALQKGVSAYNTRMQEGLLRNLVIRYSQFENKFMVILITNPTEDRSELEFIKTWAEEIENTGLTGSIISAFKEKNSPVKIISYQTLGGKDFIVEEILGVKYKISPFSFFQTNFLQLNEFIQNIINFSELQESELIWDLYCGTGSISLPAAKYVKKVIGLELVESAINDAKSNAELNNITNTEFFAEDLHTKKLPEIFTKLKKPDNIIIDPPRAGMHENIIQHLLELEVPKITYVSCNPTTMARDCQLLSEKYQVVKLMPVDMFPQTYHIEAIAQIRLKSSF